jgi:hypothetical protein
MFTICSITRYSGASNHQRILTCDTTNWLHGHVSGNAGAIYYGATTGLLAYSISTRTNWVVACGRNTVASGASGVIINGVVTSTAEGGVADCKFTIAGWQFPSKASDWQLSKLYVWNRHLSNAEFAEASAKLNSFVAVQTLSCSATRSASTRTR